MTGFLGIRKPPGGRALVWRAAAAAAVFALSACASPRALLQNLNSLAALQHFPEAAQLVRSAKDKNYGAKNALLYHLDLGMLTHLARAYEDSNQSFETAKRLAAELFTKSVTKEVSTFLVSDNMRPYHGEDFERALLHVFAALNYHLLGKDDEALVEARQVDFLLTKLKTDYGHKNLYTEDAFVRYLMGLFYENQGAVNDAYISYWKALEAYERFLEPFGVDTPRALVGDALRAARRLGFDDEAGRIRKRWGDADAPPLPKGSGEAVVLHYNGPAPYKVDTFFEIAFAAGWPFVTAAQPQGKEQEQVEQASAIARSILASDIVRVAFPKYVKPDYAIRTMAVRSGSSTQNGTSERVQDVGAIAVKNLEDRIGRIRAKAIARAVVKFALSRRLASAVEERKGAGAAWLTKKILQVASTATELSDKRCWQTLPDQIAMARLVLPAGTHDLHAAFRDGEGRVLKEADLPGVAIQPGRRTFVVVRTVR